MLLSATTSTTTAAAALLSPPSPTTYHRRQHQQLVPFPSKPLTPNTTRLLQVCSSATNNTPSTSKEKETIFFDGGAHYGDLVANLMLGFTLFWLPLTLAAVSRAFFLRYRFTNLRVTVISGFSGEDRSDFSYKVIKDVQVVPRFIGEWGDIVITLQDGTKVDLRSVPKFRDIANYCLSMAHKPLLRS